MRTKETPMGKICHAGTFTHWIEIKRSLGICLNLLSLNALHCLNPAERCVLFKYSLFEKREHPYQDEMLYASKAGDG